MDSNDLRLACLHLAAKILAESGGKPAPAEVISAAGDLMNFASGGGLRPKTAKAA